MQMIDAFSSLPYTDRYVFCGHGKIHVGERVIDIGDIDCGGAYCQILFCEDEGAYGYYNETVGSLAICNVVYVDYETLTPTLISRLVLQDDEWDDYVYFYQNTIYFRDNYKLEGDRNFYARFYRCDLSTRIFEKVENEEIAELEIVRKALASKDQTRSSLYDIEYYDPTEEMVDEANLPAFLYGYAAIWGLFANPPCLKITHKETGEVKYVTEQNFCEWANEALPFRSWWKEVPRGAAYERDGEIYLMSAVGIGFFGFPSYVYIVKYDFDKESFEYYTCFYVEEYPESNLQIYIPQE